VWHAVSEALPASQPDRGLLLQDFKSKQILIDALAASSYLPNWSAHSPVTQLGNLTVYDGGFTYPLPCPPGQPAAAGDGPVGRYCRSPVCVVTTDQVKICTYSHRNSPNGRRAPTGSQQRLMGSIAVIRQLTERQNLLLVVSSCPLACFYSVIVRIVLVCSIVYSHRLEKHMQRS
jgi:hypothetical protein